MSEKSNDVPAITVTFLGVGGASQEGLGHASAVVEYKGKRLLIDCGPGTTKRFLDHFQCLPDAVYVTHCHLDHVGDFENLFIKSWFSQPSVQPKVFVPAAIVPLLHSRVGSYPAALAEGSINFWDAFQLVPVGQGFIFNGLNFRVIPVRHHAPNTAFGLCVPKVFFYTGDTRPIPEVFAHEVNQGEIIFHDCGVVSNPSHTGIDDVLREYSDEVRKRLHCYHYYTVDDVQHFHDKGLRVVKQGDVFSLDEASE